MAVSGAGASSRWLERELELLADRGLREADLRQEVIARITSVVPADGWTLQSVDPETLLVHDCMFSSGVDPEFAPAFYETEYGPVGDFATHRALVHGRARGSVLGPVTQGEPGRSTRFRRVLEPQGFAHELRVAAVTGDTPWLMVDLYRRPGRRDFDAEELAMLVRAQRTLARTHGAAVAATAAASDLAEPSQALPATILLSTTGEIVGGAGPVEAYLEALRSVAHPEIPVPAALLSIALAAALEPEQRPVRMRALSQSQGWFTITAALLQGAERPDIAITVAPSHGSELTGLRMRMLDLTPGERRVCELVLAGASTKLIAGELVISPYTVQDRLKAIFAKAQVGSRGELVALLSA